MKQSIYRLLVTGIAILIVSVICMLTVVVVMLAIYCHRRQRPIARRDIFLPHPDYQERLIDDSSLGTGQTLREMMSEMTDSGSGSGEAV